MMFIRASHNSRIIQTIAGFQEQIDLSRGLGRIIVRTDSDSAAAEHLAILHAACGRAIRPPPSTPCGSICRTD